MNDSIGMIETRGYVGSVEASDTMDKATDVAMTGCEKIGSGMDFGLPDTVVPSGRVADSGTFTSCRGPPGSETHKPF